jgi:hypothetical protein
MRVLPLIIAGPLIGLHCVFAVSSSPPFTEFSSTVSPPAAAHGRVVPLEAAEMLMY